MEMYRILVFCVNLVLISGWTDEELDFFDSISHSRNGSQVIGKDFVGRLGFGEAFEISSELSWIEKRLKVQGTNYILMSSITKGIYPVPWTPCETKLECRLSLNITDSYLLIGEAVYVSDVIAYQMKKCDLEALPVIRRKWNATGYFHLKDMTCKHILSTLVPLNALKVKKSPYVHYHETRPGVWAAFFKPIDFIIKGTLKESFPEKRRSYRSYLQAQIPLAEIDLSVGLMGYENICNISTFYHSDYFSPATVQRMYCNSFK
ncbi:hypothetical protein DSO57_1022728 [Entomophthora muscae]|uniref:Uncharacterized protein n=1 Tax=Entomophthora muscae TaxID=34485 RepID=A0ACC2S5D8_9FUNG|nr:hypothetical protein DSO57_1022728 [Entomophthora muscae]